MWNFTISLGEPGDHYSHEVECTLDCKTSARNPEPPVCKPSLITIRPRKVTIIVSQMLNTALKSMSLCKIKYFSNTLKPSAYAKYSRNTMSLCKIAASTGAQNTLAHEAQSLGLGLVFMFLGHCTLF